jgi:hypothetical protein
LKDIYGALVKPVYIQDAAAKAAAIDDFKTEFAPSQLAHLEKLVGPDGTFSQNGRILVGDILVVCGELNKTEFFFFFFCKKKKKKKKKKSFEPAVGRRSQLGQLPQAQGINDNKTKFARTKIFVSRPSTTSTTSRCWANLPRHPDTPLIDSPLIQ